MKDKQSRGSSVILLDARLGPSSPSPSWPLLAPEAAAGKEEKAAPPLLPVEATGAEEGNSTSRGKGAPALLADICLRRPPRASKLSPTPRTSMSELFLAASSPCPPAGGRWAVLEPLQLPTQLLTWEKAPCSGFCCILQVKTSNPRVRATGGHYGWRRRGSRSGSSWTLCCGRSSIMEEVLIEFVVFGCRRCFGLQYRLFLVMDAGMYDA